MNLPPLTVECPCGTEIDIPIVATLAFDDERQQHLEFDPDYADLWAHSWTHDTGVNYEFENPT